MTVVAGMFTPADGDRVRNTLVAAGPEGTAHYDKIHLFDAFGFAESDTVAAGDDPVIIAVGGRDRRADHLLRRPLPRALHPAGRAGGRGDLRGRVVGVPAPARSTSGSC